MLLLQSFFLRSIPLSQVLSAHLVQLCSAPTGPLERRWLTGQNGTFGSSKAAGNRISYPQLPSHPNRHGLSSEPEWESILQVTGHRAPLRCPSAHRLTPWKMLSCSLFVIDTASVATQASRPETVRVSNAPLSPMAYGECHPWQNSDGGRGPLWAVAGMDGRGRQKKTAKGGSRSPSTPGAT